MQFVWCKECCSNFFENWPDVICKISEDGIITSLSSAFEKITGWSCSEWIGKPFNGIIHPDDLPFAIEKLQHVLREQTLTPFEIRILSKSGEYLAGEFTFLSLIRNDTGVSVFIFGRDITNRKRIENALQESEETFRALAETATAAIGIYQGKKFYYVNAAAQAIIGYTEKELLAMDAWDFVHPDFKEIVKERSLARQRKEQVPSRYEIRIVTKKGEDRWLDLAATYITLNGAPAGVVIALDVTKRKQAEEKVYVYQKQLRSLASRLSLIEERERHRIATDLHDHIGQTLALSKIKLGELQELLSSNNLVNAVEEIRYLIEQAINYTRSLTFDLSPPILYELSLEAAVEWLIEKFQKKHNIQVHFEKPRQCVPMDNEIRIFLFQSIRELLTNVAKHAQAHTATASIHKDNGNIRVSIEDDGIGFDASEINSFSLDSNFGLFSIRERLSHIRGYLEVKSKPGHGCRITMVVPLKPEEKSAMEGGST